MCIFLEGGGGGGGEEEEGVEAHKVSSICTRLSLPWRPSNMLGKTDK